MASVKVAVRVRPFNKRELELNSAMIIEMEGHRTHITNVKLPTSGNDSLGRERVKQFTYDYSYWSVDEHSDKYASQKKVFDDLGIDVVQSAFLGYNACVFAYGQTGSGKTYTMMGSQDNQGLTPRVCESLFAGMMDGETTYRTEVSYLEIYNERVRDLLRDRHQSNLNLKVREHPKEGPYVQDLSKHVVLSYADIEELLNRGNTNRTTAATHMNDHSSRSHAIFTIVFTQAKFNEEVPSEVHSKIHLVDLAGSERADSAGTSGERLKEGGSINKSLVTLGNVISSLADMCDKEKPEAVTPRRSVFIPYRDSVLTWLLKDSIGGNAKTIMIATVSPADCQYAETLSTLRYARRAKKIINKPMINEDPNVRLIRELRAENARLRALLADSMKQGAPTALEEVVETKEKLTRNEEKVNELIECWTCKWHEAENILSENQTLALRKEGQGVVLDSDLPYFLCIDDHVLSTGMKLYHLKEGITSIGRDDASTTPDIVLVGPYIEAEHCLIKHAEGEVHLQPIGGAMCYINNVRVNELTRLSQGSLIRLGRGHVFRFNHPREAAALREQMKTRAVEGIRDSFANRQWTWSTVSMTDSAVGSDMGDLEEYDQLEAKRKEVERVEKAHCFAEAQRMAKLASEASDKDQLAQQQRLLKMISLNGHDKIDSMTNDLEHRHNGDLQERERLLREEERLHELEIRLLEDKVATAAERSRIARQNELERARLDIHNERQLAEWSEINQQQHHLHVLREKDQRNLEEHRRRLEKVRDIEKKVWTDELTELKAMVESELHAMHSLCAWSTLNTSLISSDDLGARLPAEGVEDSDDDKSFDVESLRLVLPAEDYGNGLPDLYLMKSPLPAKEPPDGCSALDSVFAAGSNSCSASALMAHLAEEVNDVHSHVCRTLQRKYSSVLRKDDHTARLSNDTLAHFERIKQLFLQLEDLTTQHGTQPLLADQLKEFDRLLSTADNFLQIHALLQNTTESSKVNRYDEAADNVETIQSMLSEMDLEEEIELQVQKSLQMELCVVRESLLFALGEAWNRLVSWTTPSDTRRSRPVLCSQTAKLDLYHSAEQRALMLVITGAMQRANMLVSRLKMLVDRLMKYVIEPVVRGGTAVTLEVVEDSEQCVIRVVVDLGAQQNTAAPAPAIIVQETFQKLESVFVALHSMFVKPPNVLELAQHQGASQILSHHPTNELLELQHQGTNEVLILQRLAQLITGRVFECVYHDCLSVALPKTADDTTQWDIYRQIIEQTECFQDKLACLSMLPPDEPSLMDYLNNVNSLFANIKSQEILKRAQEFMMQDMTQSIQISTDNPLGLLGTACGDAANELGELVKKFRVIAGTNSYKLPTCHVSVPICGLVQLAFETLKEAQSGSQEVAYQLSTAIYNMFELYCEIVPSYHSDKIAAVPLVAALHHTNCMFIAHHLITLDKCLRLKLIPRSSSSSSAAASSHSPSMYSPPSAACSCSSLSSCIAGGEELQLADLVPVIKALGNDSFTEHVQTKKQLCQYLHEAPGFICAADDDGREAMAVVDGLFHHLKSIAQIWVKVLPTNVYCRSIGSLLNVAVNDVIDSVVHIEEFSADDCHSLQKVLDHLVNSSVELFQIDTGTGKTSAEVTTHESVSDWMKLKELSMMLGFNLQQVSDRWADGMGPLALYFNSGEVAQLVVAMFEKTARRDALLSSLKHQKSIHLT